MAKSNPNINPFSKSGTPPPALKQGEKMVPLKKKKGKVSVGTGDKVCPPCKKSGKTSCTHM